MEFSNIHVVKSLDHISTPLLMGNFPTNDTDHYFTLCDNSHIKEFILPFHYGNDLIEMTDIYLRRPCDDMLQSLGHIMTNNTSKYANMNRKKITYALHYRKHLYIGYEDGLVLVWQQQRREIIPKSKLRRNNSMHLSNKRSQKYIKYIDKDRLTSVITEMDNRDMKERLMEDFTYFLYKDDEQFIKSSIIDEFTLALTETIPGENDRKFKYKTYFNIYWLKYIFIGQTQEITTMFIYKFTKREDKYKYLLTASKDSTIKIYNLYKGDLAYNINIESSYINYICVFNTLKQDANNKRKKIKVDQINLIANSPAKITLDFKSDPNDELLINNFTCNYNTINKMLHFNDKFYLLGNEGQCYILNSYFILEHVAQYERVIPLLDMIPFKEYFIFLTSRLEMAVCVIKSVNEDNNVEQKDKDAKKKDKGKSAKSKPKGSTKGKDKKGAQEEEKQDDTQQKIIELFHIKIGEKRISNLLLRDDVLYLTCKDNVLYSIDLNYEFEIYNARCLMKKEELFSEEYNKFVESKKGKKKKRGKSAGKKKSPSPKKLPPIKKK